MLFFRQLRHLLPRARAWDLNKATKTLRLFFEALADEAADDRGFLDDVYADLHPDTTRRLDAWEREFGLLPATAEANRRLNLKAAWKANGGQSPAYIQDVLQTAGFDLYVHEWWVPGSSPRTARDPRNYTAAAYIGTYQCFDDTGQPQCFDGPSQPQCNRFLSNSPGYLVNKTLRADAPPAIPSDQSKWPYFLYIGAETFPGKAQVDPERRDELERLLLKICPTQHWIVLLVNYDPGGSDLFYFNGGDGFDEGDWASA